MNKTIITTDSATLAAKVQKLFVRNGIPSKLVKITESTMGCTHGVTVYDSDFISAVGILKEHGIAYSVHRH